MQVAVPHEKVDAMRLRRNRVAFALPDDLKPRHFQLVPALLFLVGFHQARHPQRGFLSELAGRISWTPLGAAWSLGETWRIAIPQANSSTEQSLSVKAGLITQHFLSAQARLAVGMAL